MDPGFSWGGGWVGTNDYGHSDITNSKQEVPYGRGSWASESSRVVDALSCYLSLILKHSDTKHMSDKKNNSLSNLGGHVPVAPPGSATEARRVARGGGWGAVAPPKKMPKKKREGEREKKKEENKVACMHVKLPPFNHFQSKIKYKFVLYEENTGHMHH